MASRGRGESFRVRQNAGKEIATEPTENNELGITLKIIQEQMAK